MIIYIFFVAIILIFYYIDKILNPDNKITFLLKLSFFIVFLFSALRFNVGWDYIAYYETIVNGTNTNIMNNNEQLTIMLIKFSQYLRMPIIYFATNSLITILCVYLYIKKESSNYWQSLLIFIFFPLFYLNSFSVIRIFSAISIVLYSTRFLDQNKNFKFIFYVIVASMFHMTAIISLIYLFLKRIDLLSKKYIIPMVISIILIPKFLYFMITNYFPQYSSYILDTNNVEGTKAILIITFFAVILFFVKKYYLKRFNNIIIVNSFTLGCLIYLTFISKGTLGHRLSLYFTMQLVVIAPNIIELFKGILLRRIMLTIIQIVLIASFFWTINVGRDTYIPYHTYEVIINEN